MQKPSVVERRPTVASGAGPRSASLLARARRSLTFLVGATRVQGLVAHAPLVLALTVGAFLRLWQINSLGYNSDEVVYAAQGAAIAGVPVLKDVFPIFRAHPLLFQFLLAVVFSVFGISDLLGRLMSVILGLITISMVYRLGKALYGHATGLLAALFIAVMPYHVVVTRQVLLDGPMVLCATLALYLIVRFADTQRSAWLYAAGAAMGLAFLAKETSIVLMGAIYVFLALSPEIRVRIHDLVIAVACMVLVAAAFPLSLTLAGSSGSKAGQNYLIWQLFRRPNHEWTFYPTAVPPAIGLLVILSALLGLWLLRHRRTWRERLLIWWILVPTIFFQLWPTKGFQYLLPTASALAILAARPLATSWPSYVVLMRRSVPTAWLRGLAIVAIALSLLATSWSRVQVVASDSFLAGLGGIPGGREAGLWVYENVPEGAKLITIGPSMANIIQFYGYRSAYGLSVSSNPLRRNPSYQPIRNPDYQIRTGAMQYLVWDAFSGARSTYFSERLLEYARRYNAHVVHTETVQVVTPEGETVEKPVIVIYEVRP